MQKPALSGAEKTEFKKRDKWELFGKMSNTVFGCW